MSFGKVLAHLERAPEHQKSLFLSSDQITNFFSSIPHHLYTIYLFTASDLKTILFPSTFFALCSSLSLTDLTTTSSPTTILSRTPLILLWIYLNLLPFNISNQNRPSAILEDRINKSWRPIPSGRISATNAKYLMLSFYAIAVLTSTILHALTPCILLICLGYLYNDLSGADYSPLLRNILNAFGFTSFFLGGIMVASGPLTPTLSIWLLIIALIVFSTVQMQDIPDQAGDSQRGRKTVPLVIGDEPARWSVAAPVAVWSVIVPTFWGTGVWGYVLPVGLGMMVAARVVLKRKVEGDKRTFKIWNLWMMGLYVVPVVKRLGG